MNTNTHSIAPEEIMAFVDGELTGVYGDFVRGHIAECGQCQQTAAEIRQDSQVLRGWHVEPLPDHVKQNVLADPLLAKPGKSTKRFLPRIPVWTKWAAGAVFTVLAIFILGAPNLMRSHSVAGKPVTQNQAMSYPSASPASGAVGGAESRQQMIQTYEGLIKARERAALSESLEESKTERDDSAREDNATPPPVPPAQAPMIARTVSLNIVVKDFASARGSLDTILSRHHGYAAELTVNTTENATRTLNASLRVPAPELAAALNELKGLGRVDNETQSGEEVRQQHADLVARLKNSRETEQRLQAILLQRAGKISDVLQVEQEIARVRGEIEQMEAEQKSLEHRVDFATVTLNLSDVYQAQLTAPYSIGTRLRNGFVTGYHNATETLLGIALFFIEAGPSLLIWLILLGLPVVFVWRRYRRSLASV